MVATFYIKKFFACSRSLLALHFIRIDYGEDNNNNNSDELGKSWEELRLRKDHHN